MFSFLRRQQVVQRITEKKMEDMIDEFVGTPGKVLIPGPIQSFPLLCTGITLENMSLWYRSPNTNFGVIPIRSASLPNAKVEGHIYKLTADELNQLDNENQVDVQFDRKRVLVHIPYRDFSGEWARGEVWMYVGQNDYWLDQIRNPDKMFGDKFQLARRFPSQDPVANGRFAFYQPLVEANVARGLTEKMRKHVAKRNRSAMRKMWLDKFNDLDGVPSSQEIKGRLP